MDLGKKLATLLKATIRGNHSATKKTDQAAPENPSAQLESLHRAMADVEAKEQQVADLLKAAKSQVQIAEKRGNMQEVTAQNRLIAELETHLDHQSTQAISLTEKLQQVEATLDAQRKGDQARAAAEEATLRASEAEEHHQTQSASIPLHSTNQPSSGTDEPDLADRKSRLSG